MSESDGEWIGVLRFDAECIVIKIDGALTGDIPAQLGLPNERIFGLELRQSGDGDQWTARAHVRNEGLTLRGTSSENLATGTARLGERIGQFELRSVRVWDLAAYRALIAPYEIAGVRSFSVHVNADEWVGKPVLFYSEGDRFVRLYPDAFGNLISESAECFVLAPDGAGIESMFSLANPAEGTLPVARTNAWTEELVSIEGPAGTLAGSLLRPPGPGPHAAVVLIHGAAGGRRDYYRAFAEHFVQAGLAALVYDRRGWGESTGNPYPTWSEKADDAAAWIDWLASRPDIDGKRIGVWGFSNGSWVAPMVAVRRPNVAFVVVIGASGTTPVETEIHRRVFDLREQGVPEDQVATVAEMWRIIYDLLLTRKVDEAARARFDLLAARLRDSAEIKNIRVQEYAIQEPFLGSVPPYASYQEVYDDMHNHTGGEAWTCDPVDSYLQIKVPVLYMVGENDSNLPAMVSANRVSRALRQAGNEHATVLLFPNAGHAMNFSHPNPIGMNDEEAGYRLHDYRFVGGFVDIVRCWAAARAKGR